MFLWVCVAVLERNAQNSSALYVSEALHCRRSGQDSGQTPWVREQMSRISTRSPKHSRGGCRMKDGHLGLGKPRLCLCPSSHSGLSSFWALHYSLHPVNAVCKYKNAVVDVRKLMSFTQDLYPCPWWIIITGGKTFLIHDIWQHTIKWILSRIKHKICDSVHHLNKWIEVIYS